MPQFKPKKRRGLAPVVAELLLILIAGSLAAIAIGYLVLQIHAAAVTARVDVTGEFVGDHYIVANIRNAGGVTVGIRDVRLLDATGQLVVGIWPPPEDVIEEALPPGHSFAPRAYYADGFAPGVYVISVEYWHDNTQHFAEAKVELH